MKKATLNWIIPIVLLLTAQNCPAQQNDWVEYLKQRLEGKESDIHRTHSLKIKEIGKARQAMWNAWQKANALYEEEKLVLPDTLSVTHQGAWHLPQELEPHATMNYYFGYKGTAPTDGYPFFLYLHGSGPKAQEWNTGLKLAQLFEDSPSLYFIPQIPNEGEYYRWYHRSKQYAWEKLFRQVMLLPEVNPDRLYLFGISEGGYGSQRLASFYADYLAAAGPMAGGEPLKNAPAENCRHIGFCLRTGALDRGFYRNQLTHYTLLAFDSLQTLYPSDYRHRIELIPGQGHHIDYRPTTPWLKQHIRQACPKQMTWEDYEMDGMHRKGFYNLVVVERPDSLLRTRYDMNIENNHIELQVRNVHYRTLETDPQFGIEMKFDKEYTMAQKGRIIIYLNEEMVDLKEEINVTLNGHKVFCGKIKCNKIHMANSLLTFYDPRRIFPAAIEVEI